MSLQRIVIMLRSGDSVHKIYNLLRSKILSALERLTISHFICQRVLVYFYLFFGKIIGNDKSSAPKIKLIFSQYF